MKGIYYRKKATNTYYRSKFAERKEYMLAVHKRWRDKNKDKLKRVRDMEKLELTTLNDTNYLIDLINKIKYDIQETTT